MIVYLVASRSKGIYIKFLLQQKQFYSQKIKNSWYCEPPPISIELPVNTDDIRPDFDWLSIRRKLKGSK